MIKRLVVPPLLALGLLALTLGILSAAADAAPPATVEHAQLLANQADVSGLIDQPTTWDLANSPYTMTGDVVVASGVTLTVEPGVRVLAIGPQVELRVLGYLQAVGTADQPITFSSVADSGPDQWGGLVFNGGTGHLRHVTVRYGGGNSIRSGNVVADNVVDGQLLVEESRILSAAVTSPGSTSYGVYVRNSRLSLHNSHVAGNGKQAGDYGFFVADKTSAVTVTDSVFEGNAGWALAIQAADLHRVTGNHFANNQFNRILVFDGSLAADTSLTAQSGLEGYELQGIFGFPRRGLTVPSGITLTLAPDVALLGQSGSELTVLGHLQAVGTAAQPITLTSVADSGQDQWGGLLFDGGTGHLRHVTVRYAGQGSEARANITAKDVMAGNLLVESSHIFSGGATSLGSTSYGVYVRNSRVIISDTQIWDNGKGAGDANLYATGAGTYLTVTDSALTEMPGIGLWIDQGAQATVRCTTIAENQAGGMRVRDGSRLFIIGSDISANVQFGLQNESGETVQAGHNWWGGAEGPYHLNLNPSGLVDSQISGDALFTPWIETTPTCSPLVDVALRKTGNPNPVQVGHPLTYTLTVANQSPDGSPVSALMLTDTLPASLTVGTLVSSQGSCAATAGSVTCALQTLGSGASATVTLVVTPTVPAALHNRAQLSLAEADVSPSNNSAESETSVQADSDGPVILGLSPESLIQGSKRTLTIEGLNFAPGLTVTLAPSATQPSLSNGISNGIGGNILSLISTTIEVQFDVTDLTFLGAWIVTVANDDGKSASHPIFIDAPLIWLDFEWDGVRGFPIVPPGQERRNSWAMYNLGYADGLALMTITPPDPGLIRLKIGASPMGSIWDSTQVTDSVPVSVTLLVPVAAGQEINLPLYWGISPEDVNFEPAAALQSAALRQANGPRPGQNRQVSFRGLQGAAKDQAKGMVRNVILNSLCENLKDRIAAHYGQGGDPSILNNAIDATINELQSATDPQNIFKTIVNKLAGTPVPVQILVSIGNCAGQLANSFINSFHTYTGQLANQICQDKEVEKRVVEKVAKQWRGRISGNRALVIAYSRPPGSCRPQAASYEQTNTGQIRGPWDPNDKAAYPTRSCQLGEVDGITQCVRHFVSMAQASAPITYVVQFENKAVATDPAQTVVITDLLDDALDPTSFQIVGASHPTTTHPGLTFSVEISGQLVTMRFTNINLPPNQTPPEGEGYVIFSVRPRANLPLGTEIRNQASIVFDFNPAIETAEVVHLLVDDIHLPIIQR